MNDWCAQIDFKTSGVIEDRDGFRVYLFVHTEDGGVYGEGRLIAKLVIVQCVNPARIRVEKLLVD